MNTYDDRDRRHDFVTADVQDLEYLQEKIDEAIMEMESNVEVMGSLQSFYIRLRENTAFDLKTRCANDIDAFARELQNLMSNFKLQISQAKGLFKRITGRAELVKHHRLERLNQHMEHEAIVMRIITIGTLIYLPATFVSVSPSLKLARQVSRMVLIICCSPSSPPM